MRPRTAVVVTVDPRLLAAGVYEGTPGYVTTYSATGTVHHRRQATEPEALAESYMQRFEAAIERLGEIVDQPPHPQGRVRS